MNKVFRVLNSGLKKGCIFLFLLVVVSSCTEDSINESSAKAEIENDATKEKSDPEEPSQEELNSNTMKLIATVMSPSDLDFKLNGDKPWLITEDAYTRFMKMKQQIYVISGNMESYEVSSYNEMGKEFLDFAKQIQPDTDENTNVEVQKVISAIKAQCVFMLGSNLQQSQIAVINLSVILDEVPSFFITE